MHWSVQALQLPENLPYPKTTTGVFVAAIVTVVMPFVLFKVIKSRWAWVPGLVIGLVAGAVAVQ